MTVIVLLQARNEESFLPGWLANLEGVADGIIALDDGSEDATAEILSAHPNTRKVIRKPAWTKWDERGNQIVLVQEGRKLGASWFLCIDADERVDPRFAEQLPALLAAADEAGIDAFSFRLRELWGDRGHYRSDGLWGRKTRFRLFRNVLDHRRFDPRFLHRTWLPLEIVLNIDRVGRGLEYNLYHLGMMRAEDRLARYARYKALDPSGRFQKIGYEYLLDESCIELTAIPPELDFVPVDEFFPA
jgi:glycosyltransferase involved in cell wall biosynthesis